EEAEGRRPQPARPRVLASRDRVPHVVSQDPWSRCKNDDGGEEQPRRGESAARDQRARVEIVPHVFSDVQRRRLLEGYGCRMRGAIAAGHPLTAEAGAQVLSESGNAVDAAVAAAFVSWGAESPVTGPGAGGLMPVHRSHD